MLSYLFYLSLCAFNTNLTSVTIEEINEDGEVVATQNFDESKQPEKHYGAELRPVEEEVEVASVTLDDILGRLDIAREDEEAGLNQLTKILAAQWIEDIELKLDTATIEDIKTFNKQNFDILFNLPELELLNVSLRPALLKEIITDQDLREKLDGLKQINYSGNISGENDQSQFSFSVSSSIATAPECNQEILEQFNNLDYESKVVILLSWIIHEMVASNEANINLQDLENIEFPQINIPTIDFFEAFEGGFARDPFCELDPISIELLIY